MKKIISIILVFLIVFATFTTFATTIEGVIGGDANAVSFDNGLASKVLGFMQFIGYAIAVGMLMYIGIKYVSSAADERASLKGALVKYVIGAILIAAATTVVSIIIGIGNPKVNYQNNKTTVSKPSIIKPAAQRRNEGLE